MTKLQIINADIVVTMDGARREVSGGNIVVEDGLIVSVGKTGRSPDCDETIDARGCVVTPGLVNTHHHLFQTLTRAVPAGQDALLFDWLRALYPIWARMQPEDMFVSAQLGLAELALSGCTMSSDHLYIFPNGVTLEDTVDAARTVGLRFHPTRGAMSVGESDGGLPPDSLVGNAKIAPKTRRSGRLRARTRRPVIKPNSALAVSAASTPCEISPLDLPSSINSWKKSSTICKSPARATSS